MMSVSVYSTSCSGASTVRVVAMLDHILYSIGLSRHGHIAWTMHALHNSTRQRGKLTDLKMYPEVETPRLAC